MADIRVERKRRSPVPLIFAVLLLAILGFLAWRYMAGEQTPNRGTAPAAPAAAPAAPPAAPANP